MVKLRGCAHPKTLPRKEKAKHRIEIFAEQMAEEELTSKLKIKTKIKNQTTLVLVNLSCYKKISHNKITTGIRFLIVLEARKSSV